MVRACASTQLFNCFHFHIYEGNSDAAARKRATYNSRGSYSTPNRGYSPNRAYNPHSYNYHGYTSQAQPRGVHQPWTCPANFLYSRRGGAPLIIPYMCREHVQFLRHFCAGHDPHRRHFPHRHGQHFGFGGRVCGHSRRPSLEQVE